MTEPRPPECSKGSHSIGAVGCRLFGGFGLLFCVVAVGLAGCSRTSPEESLNAIMQAAESGDMEAFLEGLTPESRHILEGLHSIPTGESNPLALGGYDHTVRAVEADVEGTLAYVTVQTDQQPKEAAVVILRLIEDRWRLDLVETELLWNSRWTLSGGKGRASFGTSSPLVPLPTLP